jgi:hypothetical protein
MRVSTLQAPNNLILHNVVTGGFDGAAGIALDLGATGNVIIGNVSTGTTTGLTCSLRRKLRQHVWRANTFGFANQALHPLRANEPALAYSG